MWVTVHEVDPVAEWDTLERGEREAIALALALKADLVSMDERKGQSAPMRDGLTVIGTLGVLEETPGAA